MFSNFYIGRRSFAPQVGRALNAGKRLPWHANGCPEAVGHRLCDLQAEFCMGARETRAAKNTPPPQREDLFAHAKVWPSFLRASAGLGATVTVCSATILTLALRS
jgi:hypothetical protein